MTRAKKKIWKDWLHEHLTETNGEMNVHEIVNYLLTVRTKRTNTPLREIPSKNQVSQKLKGDKRFKYVRKRINSLEVGGYEVMFWRSNNAFQN